MRMQSRVSSGVPDGAIRALMSPDTIQRIIEEVLGQCLRIETENITEANFFVEPTIKALPHHWSQKIIGPRSHGCQLNLVEVEAPNGTGLDYFRAAVNHLLRIAGEEFAKTLDLDDSIEVTATIESTTEIVAGSKSISHTFTTMGNLDRHTNADSRFGLQAGAAG